MMLHANYEISNPYGLGQEGFFKKNPLYLLVKTETTQHRTNFHYREIICCILVEGHLMFHAKYESSSPYGSGREKMPSLSLCEIRDPTT